MKFPILDKLLQSHNLTLSFVTKPVWTGGLTADVTIYVSSAIGEELAGEYYWSNRLPVRVRCRVGHTVARAGSRKAQALARIERAVASLFSEGKQFPLTMPKVES